MAGEYTTAILGHMEDARKKYLRCGRLELWIGYIVKAVDPGILIFRQAGLHEFRSLAGSRDCGTLQSASAALWNATTTNRHCLVGSGGFPKRLV